jgi:ATP-binding cassette, subfamily F, member 3
MPVLTFSSISKEYAGEFVFTGLSGSVQDTSVIGIVGPNGIGKTTLLKLISGNEEFSDGTVSKAKATRIGYLQQEAIDAFAEKQNTVFEEMVGVFSHLLVMEEKLSFLEVEMGKGDSLEPLLEEYGALQQKYEAGGGYEYALRIQKTLGGLGFSAEDRDMPLTHCSGGQKTRALLARLLLEEPDLLILDEPTNHLDTQAVEWLEGVLLRWEKAIVIVSHDRHFLDTTVDEIWEMNSLGIEKYKGNYSAYTMQRQERRIRREKTFDATIDFFLKELFYIRRFIDKKTTQAKGRLKRLVRHVKAVEIGGPEALDMKWSYFSLETGGVSNTKWSVNETERHIRALKVANPYTKPMQMRIEATDHMSTKVLSVEDGQIGYPSASLFTLDFGEILGGDRVALIGSNGCGKSTFLKTLLGDMPSLSGSVRLGESIKVGYFAQSHDILDPGRTVVEEILVHGNGMLEAEARQYLGRYLFSDDDVFKRTASLSGGERGRLTLALLALEKVNFLVLDEPTNHLDIQSREILEDALLHFKGTILFVTHDRYLIDRLATQIWSIDQSRLAPFPGSYGEYKASLLDELPAPAKPKGVKVRHTVPDPERDIAAAEERIHFLEEKLDQLSQKLETAVETGNERNIKEWTQDYHATKDEIRELLERWETLSVS